MSEERVIVVAAEDACGLYGQVSDHFGRCPFFVLAEVNGYLATVSRVVPNPYFGEHQPGRIAQFIRDLDADAIIAGGMGRWAIDMFHGFGIDVAIGTTGTVAEVLEAYLRGIHRGTISSSGGHRDSRDGSRPVWADPR